MTSIPRLRRLAIVSVLVCIVFAALPLAASAAGPGKVSDSSAAAQTASVCEEIRRQQKLPANVARRVADDCRRNSARFRQNFNGAPLHSTQNLTDLPTGRVTPPPMCSRCTTFCQTTTFAGTYDWSIGLGGGMTPAQCMEAAQGRCRAAYRSTLAGASCQTR